MRNYAKAMAVLIAALSTNVVASDNLMGASDVTCRDYLSAPADSVDRVKMSHWVSGRVVAIIPAPVQPFLRKLPWSRLETDLSNFCTANPDEDLFMASALIANDYKTEAERSPKHRGDDA